MDNTGAAPVIANLLTPEQYGSCMFTSLEAIVKRKNQLIEQLHSSRIPLHIMRQTDLPGVYKIDVDYPTDEMAIKNHYILRMQINLDGSGFTLAAGTSPAQTYPQSAYREVLRNAVKIITTYAEPYI